MGRLLGLAVVRAVAFTILGFGVTLLVMNQPPTADVMDGRPDAEGSPEALVKQHDCWTGAAPADMEGKLPGHVVVSRGVAPEYGGRRLVDLALRQIFEGEDHGLTVHGFCR